MNLKIIKPIIINTCFLILGFFMISILYSNYRKNSLLFKVDLNTIERDINLSNQNTIENTGWPSKTFALKNLKNNKYRKLNYKYDKSCIEVFGGSYTFSFNSKISEESWTSKLSNLLNCSVLNYGIPGFGTDQSVMRHEKYNSKNNISILMFVDDSLKRNIVPMLGLSYSGLAKNYDAKTFKPFYKVIDDDLVLFKPNAKEILRAINLEKNKICLGPYSLSCIFSEIYNNFKISIKTKGKHYQNIAKISKPFSDYFARNIKVKFNTHQEYSLALQLKLIKKYFSNCESVGQICYVSRFPYMRDVAYPERININPIEESLENNFPNKYISSHKTATCMKSLLGVSNRNKLIDLSVMKYEHPKNKHYLKEANNAFAKCIFNSINNFQQI